MKKLLCVLLTAVMLLSMIPAAFAADTAEEGYVYKFDRASIGSPDADVVLAYIPQKTSTNVTYVGSDEWFLGGVNRCLAIDVNSERIRYETSISRTSGIGVIAIALKVGKGGKYLPTLTYQKASNAPIVDVYLAKADVILGNYYVEKFSSCTETNANDSNLYNYVFNLKNASADKNYKIGENIDMYSESLQGGQVEELNEVSLDDNSTYYLYINTVGKGDGFVETILGTDGTTKVLQVLLESFTLTPVEEESAPVELSGNIAFAASADIQYKVASGEYTSISANNTAQMPVGSSVTVKVENTENFAGWVRGTENSGVWVSGDPEYTFNIMSPTYLTPIHTTPEENATHSVEFWDENGAYVDTVTATDGKAVLPAEDKYGLVGGEFNGWWLDKDTQLLEGDEVSKGITRAVAQYNYGTFGKEISNSNATATYWKRGDDIVKYGTIYNFYQWNGEPTITFGTEEVEENPIVVLDATSVDGAYMIEYDKGNATEIVEAGIIFGSSKDINIGSTDGSKAASQRNEAHGQFCAKPNINGASNYVRGYLIYRGADNKLYVIYTAAVATTVE